MADWVRCKSTSDADQAVWINLDLVACMTELDLGTEILCSGRQDPVIVKESAANILGQTIVRDA